MVIQLLNMSTGLVSSTPDHVNTGHNNINSNQNYSQPSKLQDAATSPTIPISPGLPGTQFIGLQPGLALFSPSNSNNAFEPLNGYKSPTSPSTLFSCSSPVSGKTFYCNTKTCTTRPLSVATTTTTNNSSTVTNSGLKTLIIKSNCKPTDLGCSLKSPTACLACYTNCSTCNSLAKNNYRLTGLNGVNNVNRINGLNGLTSNLNGISPPRVTSCSMSLNLPATTVSPTLITTTSGPSSSATAVAAAAFASAAAAAAAASSSNSIGLTNRTGQGSPIFDDSTSPTSNRNIDKFDNFNSNIFNDHCSTISAPLSHYYLNEPKNHSCFRKSIPTMPIALSVVLFLLNCFLPGSGTMLASITILFGCPTEHGKGKWKRAFLLALIAGLLQFLTAILVIGWVWSIMTGINFIKNSTKIKDPMFGMNGEAL